MLPPSEGIFRVQQWAAGRKHAGRKALPCDQELEKTQERKIKAVTSNTRHCTDYEKKF